MRIFITILVLIFSLQTEIKSDDIKDFEIEGISIGDSALNFFNIDAIRNNTYEYPNKKYKRVQNDDYDFFKIYDAVDFHYKNNDKKYIIESLSGVLIYNKNIEQCENKMDQIISEMESIFSEDVIKSQKTTFIHPSPKNIDGKSKVTAVYFTLPSGDEIDVACYDFSVAHGSQDHLNLSMQKKSFAIWLEKEAYN